MTRHVAIGCLLAAWSAAASADPGRCQLAVAGIADDAGGCAGVSVCVDGPPDTCAFRGPVRVRLGTGKAKRVRPAPGQRCVTAMHAEPGDTTAVRVAARAGRHHGKRLRIRSVVTCPASPPPAGDMQCVGLTIPVPVVGRRAEFPPSIPNEGTCAQGQSVSNYTNPTHLIPTQQASELQVVGVYESDCTRMATESPFECLVPREPITVVVGPRSKPVVLALVAYDAVTWRIEVQPGATVERVLIGGYQAQTVEGVAAGIVESLPVGQYAYGWEITNNSGGGGYWQMMAGIRDATGLVETSFQGCYTGARFTIPYAADPPTTCEPSLVTGDESVAQSDVAFPQCAAVAAESATCLSILDGGPALVGVDSGTVCSLGGSQWTGSADPSGASVGWLGEVLYQCTYGDGLVRIDLRSWARELLEMPCEAVADDGDSLLVKPGYSGSGDIFDLGGVYRVNGYQGLLAGEASRLPQLSISNERFTVNRGLVYSAWHSTNTIDVDDLVTGAAVRQVTLEGYDGWIFGLDVTDDGRLFVAGMDDAGTLLMIFDARSGARLGQHRIGAPWGAAGLACRPGTGG